jgi:hydrogenase maturation protein HypF
MTGRRIELSGVVQGLGIRPAVFRLATSLGLSGGVGNSESGVVIEVFGASASVVTFLDNLATALPSSARVRNTTVTEVVGRPVPSGFAFAVEHPDGARSVSIAADRACCDACLAELVDPANRRFQYPFIGCPECGPRFTVVTDIPYERCFTAMAPFRMCAECLAEYTSPDDRRFHSQLNCCRACGPALMLCDADGQVRERLDPIEAAADLLRGGAIVAIKGLGGYHLACDAGIAEPIEELRRRKHRDAKPFAVMVPDLASARTVAVISDAEARLMTSAERPIVLVSARQPKRFEQSVAGTSDLLGLFLPYTPIHELLLRRLQRPLVMTSANRTEEFLAYSTGDLSRLGRLADAVLTHNREITQPCDDSVASIIAGGPAVMRRGRGFAPTPFATSHPFKEPVLGCGGGLKNTFCIGVRHEIALSQHVGDLSAPATYAAYESAVERLEHLLRVTPTVVAHDLHPEYLSTRYARSRSVPLTLGVQHHHAHTASVMAEYQLSGPVLGVVFDGTGYGTDGTAWGGEILVADLRQYHRLATFRPIQLPGGDAAVRQPWRVAVSLLHDADWGRFEQVPLFKQLDRDHVAVVWRMLERGFGCASARGVGRYFDGVAALVLGIPEASYEGQLAQQLMTVLDPVETGRYGFDVDLGRDPVEIDLRQMTREILGDLSAGAPQAAIAARFHNTIVAATVDVVHGHDSVSPSMPVTLSGGCFQNAVLTERLSAALRRSASVYVPRRVPAGDGGISLGQAVIANAHFA